MTSSVKTPDGSLATPDRPWIFRTYAGHSSPRASNALFRENLSRGQTGLSIAFDLPTQCGYDSDHPMARAEVGKVGVPVNSLDDMHVLFQGIPLELANTSMTINATSPWLLALLLALARERGIDPALLAGTTQNDVIKEYLARGTYIFPPKASLRMTAEMYEYCLVHAPRFNPSNVCSYHLQEAGATPAQEIAFALAVAMGTLDLISERGHMDRAGFARCVGRVSFFLNAGIRFVEEIAKVRVFATLWDELCRDRWGVREPELRRFRYGVQVNSLGLTEAQPENNAWRIALSMLGVTLSRNARCRALQLPAWNEALSLPRPWDQQWSLRLQQVLALETDLLEVGDLFDGSQVMAALESEIAADTRAELAAIEKLGGVLAAVESGHLKGELVRSMSERIGRIQRGEQVVIGVNRLTEGLPTPLRSGDDGGLFQHDPQVVAETLAALDVTRKARDPAAVKAALTALRQAAASGENIMPPSIECALARVTTGEWAGCLRDVHGEYRAPTGLEGQGIGLPAEGLAKVQDRARVFAAAHGRRPRLVVGKPGLDGHSNGAEVIAVAARQAGFDVIYAGIRLSPAEIAQCAVEEGADLIGLSVLSGSHMELTRAVLSRLEDAGVSIPLVVGGIVPGADVPALTALGVRAVFTPGDVDLLQVLGRLLDVVEAPRV